MHHPVKVGQGGGGLTDLEASDFSSTPVSRNEKRYSFSFGVGTRAAGRGIHCTAGSYAQPANYESANEDSLTPKF